MTKLITLFFLIFCSVLFGQEIKELENSIENRKKDTILVRDYIKLGKHYFEIDSAKTTAFFNQAYDLSKEIESPQEGEASKLLGIAYFKSGDFDLGERLLKKSIEFYENTRDSLNEINTLTKLVSLYRGNDEIDKAIKLYSEFLSSKSNRPYYAFLINNYLGSLTKSALEYDLALDYYNKSASYFELVDSTQNEIILSQLSNDKNRGVIYRNQENYKKAEFFLQRSLKKSIIINNQPWIARNYNSLGLMYEAQGKTDKAIDYFEKSLEIKRDLNYTDGVITSLTNLGNLYRQQQNFPKAKKALLEADSITHFGAQKTREANVKKVLSLLYSDLNDYQKAYDYLLLNNNIMDSVQLDEKSNLIRKLDAKYKNKAFQIEQDKLKAELESADLREQNKTEQIKAQKNYILFGSSIGILLIFFALLVVRSNLKRKKINTELSKKNTEITRKNNRIEEQSHQLKIKNQEILDSINYARRIQQAILPPVKLVKSFLNDSFVLYLPKDIVAGDFYWMEPTSEHIVFAAADCTGHGVPGAMVSVICNNGLNRSVREYGLEKPSEILNKTREIVLKEFEKSEENVADGMDISLVSIPVSDLESDHIEIEYAGANNPLWVVRKGLFNEETQQDNKIYHSKCKNYSLLEIKADKQPIGKYTTKKPYTNHLLKLKKDDSIYLFSDGYVDQFGNNEVSKANKKFKPINFRKLIFDLQGKPMLEQKEVLYDVFNKWKGTLEQVDDVCVIGVKL
jgi:serine phosphatase RsbU (regulator of sigma subunit)/Flp pilus assembly protein TadD